VYIYNNMRPIKLKDLINESYINSNPFSKNLNEDLKYLEQKLIEEGLWDVIKQKVGDATNKTKEILLKPLIKLVVDKIAKDDPQGFSKLQQYADASKLKDLLNHPDIKKKESEIGKEVASVKESLSEAEHDDFIQEYIDAVLDEARVLRDDPRNVKRRERYQQRRTARAGQNPAPAPKKTNPPKVDKSKPSQPKNDEPTAGQNIKQGAAQLGKGIAQGADKLGIAAIEKGGDIMAKAMGGASKGVQALAQTDAGKAVGGLIGKIYQWTKAHPKLTASAGIALLGLIGTAAAIGSGGIVPLIVGTLGAAGSGAVKGGVIGGAVGAAKDAYSQIKGGTKSFKDLDWKKVAAAAKTGLFKGGKYGFIIGGGLHVAGQAMAGISKMAASTAKIAGDNTVIDQTIDRADWINDPKYAVKGQWNMVVERDGQIAKFRVPRTAFDEVMKSHGVDPTQPISDVQTLNKAIRAADELLVKYQAGEFTNQATSVAGNAAQAKASAASATGDAAGQATSVINQAAAEKATKGLKFVTDQAEIYKNGGGVDLDSLKDILGSVGQGASKNQTESMINAYLDGHLPKEKLVSYFTKMAMRVATN